MNKLLSSVASAKRVLDETFILRTIQSRFAPSASIEDLLPIAQHAELHEFRPGEALFLEGDEADSCISCGQGQSPLKPTMARKCRLLMWQRVSTWAKWGFLAVTHEPRPSALRLEPKPCPLVRTPLRQLLKISPTLEQSLTAEMSERLRQISRSKPNQRQARPWFF